MFSRKVRHVGDRVAAVVAESEVVALAALKLIEVEYQVLPAVMNIDEAMAPNAPLVHDEPIIYMAGAPADLEQQNACSIRRGERAHDHQLPHRLPPPREPGGQRPWSDR